jgi:hypothetical protein
MIGLAMLVLGVLVSVSLHAQPALRLEAPVAASRNEFQRGTAVRELSNGSLLVVDRDRKALLRISSLGEPATTVGRMGNGPGEYRSVGDLWPLGGDSTLLTNAFSGRWILLDGARIVRTFAESRPGNLIVRGTTDGASAAGEVVARRVLRHRAGVTHRESTADSLVIVRARLQSDLADSIAVIAGHGPEGFTVVPAAPGRLTHIVPINPLGSADQTLLFPDGWLVVVRAQPYRVEWRRPDGAWVRGPLLSSTVRRVTRAEQCEAIARAFTATWPCNPAEFNGWPATVPPLRLSNPYFGHPLIALSNGRVAIGRTEPLGDARRHYDIADRLGNRVGTLTLAPGEVLVGSSARYAYVAYTDDDGLQTLRRYGWPPSVRAPAR